jgi:hypothetical protein
MAWDSQGIRQDVLESVTAQNIKKLGVEKLVASCSLLNEHAKRIVPLVYA